MVLTFENAITEVCVLLHGCESAFVLDFLLRLLDAVEMDEGDWQLLKARFIGE